MVGFHHRDGGQVGFALRAHDVYGEVICDGIHSTTDALNTYFTAKGRDHAIMITDSLCAKVVVVVLTSLVGKIWNLRRW